MRCQPTYEELKLLALRNCISPQYRCQPTYEELKHGKTYKTVEKAQGCQPTYEELKLCLACIIYLFKALMLAYL